MENKKTDREKFITKCFYQKQIENPDKSLTWIVRKCSEEYRDQLNKK